MLDNEAATSHLLHSVQTATVPGCTTPDAIGVAAENLSAAGAFPTTELPVLRDRDGSAIDAALRADDDDYEPEVEEEVDRRREWDRILKYGMVLLFAASAFGLLLPAAPTPIDGSLPSSGLHDAGRATNPAPVTDGWRGFLWTT